MFLLFLYSAGSNYISILDAPHQLIQNNISTISQETSVGESALYIFSLDLDYFSELSANFIAMTPKYPKFEPQGDSFRRWMERADEPGCPISRTTLTTEDLDPKVWIVGSSPQFLEEDWMYWADTFGLPVDDPAINQKAIYRFQSALKHKGDLTLWIGRAGPGVIFIDDIRRQQVPTNFYMSEFTKAFYESHFPLNTLKYVIVTDINEKHTMPFIQDHVYKSREGLEFPPKEPQTWESPSPELCGILGTPLVKLSRPLSCVHMVRE